MSDLAVLAVIFGAVLVHGLTGFGSGMLAMALLPLWISLHEAAPLVSLVVITLEVFLLAWYRTALEWRAVWKLGVAMAVGAPLGVLALHRLSATALMPVLGVLLVAYALYALLNWRLPALHNPRWAVVFGLAAGLLGGLFNFSGPPVIIYAQCRRWEPRQFKASLQALFLLNHLLVAVSRAAAGSYTLEVWRYYLFCMPLMALALVSAFWLGHDLNAARLRRLALILLLMVGARLIF